MLNVDQLEGAQDGEGGGNSPNSFGNLEVAEITNTTGFVKKRRSIHKGTQHMLL